MSDARDEMIDAAVKVFGEDLEKKENARRLLEETTAVVTDAEAGKVSERLGRIDSSRRKIPWRRIYLGLTAVAVVILGLMYNRSSREEAWAFDVIRSMAGKGGLAAGSLPLHRNDLPPEARLLLGDPGEPHHVSRKKLWDSDPENPAYFSSYVSAFYGRFKTLPPDYFGVAARIDPDNAWFDYFGASVIGGDSVAKVPAAKKVNDGKQPLARTPRDYSISDRSKHEEALAIIRRGNGKSRCDSYIKEMLSKRVAVLPQSTYPEWFASFSELFGEAEPYMRLIKLGEIQAAGLCDLERVGNAGDFRKLANEAKESVLKCSGDPTYNLVQVLVLRAWAEGVSLQVSARSRKLGIESEFGWAGRWHESVEEDRREREESKKKPNKTEDLTDRKGSVLVSLAAPVIIRQSLDPPAITEQDLEPGRWKDYSWMSMLLASVCVLILSVVAAFCFNYRFRSSKVVRTLAGRVERLLEPVDWLWIVGTGAILPVFLIYFLMMFTPMGGWGYSAGSQLELYGVVRPAFNFTALVLLLVLLPVLVARWRLRKKASAFMPAGRDWFGWAAVLSLLVFGMAFRHIWLHWMSLAFGAFGFVWFIVAASRAIFSRPGRLLPRVALSRVILPALTTGIVMLSVSYFGFKEGRQYWHERDEFTRLMVEEPGPFPYEHRLAKQVHGALREMLESTSSR